MGTTLVVPPTTEPITVDEALAQARVVDDIENGLVAGYILAARYFVEKSIRVSLLQQTWDFTIDFCWPVVRFESTGYYAPYNYWRTRIELPKVPVLSVQWVQYIDSDGTLQTLDPSQYVVVTNEPVAYIEPAFGITWATPRYQSAAISIRFDAGYGSQPSDIPENVRQAMLLLVSYWVDNRGSAQFGARGRANQAGTIATSIMPAEIPPGVEALLSLDRHTRILS